MFRARPPPVRSRSALALRHGPGRPGRARRMAQVPYLQLHPAELVEVRGHRGRREDRRSAVRQTRGRAALSRLDHQGDDAVPDVRGAGVGQDPAGRPGACSRPRAAAQAPTKLGVRAGDSDHRRSRPCRRMAVPLGQRRRRRHGRKAGRHRAALRRPDDPARPGTGHAQQPTSSTPSGLPDSRQHLDGPRPGHPVARRDARLSAVLSPVLSTKSFEFRGRSIAQPQRPADQRCEAWTA